MSSSPKLDIQSPIWNTIAEYAAIDPKEKRPEYIFVMRLFQNDFYEHYCIAKAGINGFFLAKHRNWINIDSRELHDVAKDHQTNSRTLIREGAQSTMTSRNGGITVAVCAAGRAEPLGLLADSKRIDTIVLLSFNEEMANYVLETLTPIQRQKFSVRPLDFTGGLYDQMARIFAEHEDDKNLARQALESLLTTYPQSATFPKTEKFDYVISSLVGSQLFIHFLDIASEYFKAKFGEDLRLMSDDFVPTHRRMNRYYIKLLSKMVKSEAPRGRVYLADTWKHQSIDESTIAAVATHKPLPPPSQPLLYQKTIGKLFEIVKQQEWATGPTLGGFSLGYLWTSAFILKAKANK